MNSLLGTRSKKKFGRWPTDDEIDALSKHSKEELIDAMRCKEIAESASKKAARKYGKGSTAGGEADAVRHCTLACCLTQKLGRDSAEHILNAYEELTTPPKRFPGGFDDIDHFRARDRMMDDHNNKFGLDYGEECGECNDEECPTCEDLCNEKLENGGLHIEQPGGYDWQEKKTP